MSASREDLAYLAALLEESERLATAFEREIEPLWSGWKPWRWPSYFRLAERNLAERRRLLKEMRRVQGVAPGESFDRS